MKHVREPTARRAAPAARDLGLARRRRGAGHRQGDRATATPAAEEMVHDLEEVLGIEAARAGEASGEATTMLARCPATPPTSRPCGSGIPSASLVRHAVAAAVAAGGRGLLRHPHREGRRARPDRGRAARPQARCSWAGSAASDYDPEGDDRRSRRSAENLVHRRRSAATDWETETYESRLQGADKTGVGIYVDAGEPIPGRRLALITSTPDPASRRRSTPPNGVPASIGGWAKVSQVKSIARERAVPARPAARQRFRYYLVWITALPESRQGRDPGAQAVARGVRPRRVGCSMPYAVLDARTPPGPRTGSGAPPRGAHAPGAAAGPAAPRTGCRWPRAASRRRSWR